MTEPLTLFDPPPVLTVRQQRAYDAITEAGWDGLKPEQLGLVVHAHPDGVPCEWCQSAGGELGKALGKKGLVARRRRESDAGAYFVFVHIDTPMKKPRESSASFGEFPDGF